MKVKVSTLLSVISVLKTKLEKIRPFLSYERILCIVINLMVCRDKTEQTIVTVSYTKRTILIVIANLCYILYLLSWRTYLSGALVLI